ncbi:MAG: glycoside hydrolase family 9 protein [Bryobacteraceae bacterium]
MRTRVLAVTLFIAASCMASGAGPIMLNDREYFSGPGFAFLNFHNNYMVGNQGGLQMIQSGERILDSGDLFVEAKGQDTGSVVTRRVVDRSTGAVTVFGRVSGLQIDYRLVIRTDGSHIFVKMNLDRPLDWSKIQSAGFRIRLYPGVYVSKSFVGESGSGVFPHQFTGADVLLAGSHELRIGGEDPLYSVLLSRDQGALVLSDMRRDGPEEWFVVAAPLTQGGTDTSVELKITPTIRPEWRRAPVIGASQAGYHPGQPKRAILELDARTTSFAQVRLFKLKLSGERTLARAGAPKPWGVFHNSRYATFDFSDVREPGVYLLEYESASAGPFRIDSTVLEQAWQPTLEYFLPAQMCHVQVREGTRVWHGPCHLDDALQAPANNVYIDGYRQGEHETDFADNTHVPGLDWGGWHDAGDNDVPAGSIDSTILPLALAWEEFRPEIDQTTIDRRSREVNLHIPDGQPDVLQQIEYGAAWLLATYRVGGHIFPGVIESSPRAYSTLGDPATITDNRVYDSKLKPFETDGVHSGTFDDRWVFTNRNTGLQYNTAQALAAAYRVLRESRPEFASECLDVARKLWVYEQGHPPVYPANSYVPGDSGHRREEIAATAELWLTTREAAYSEHLLSLVPVIESTQAAEFGRGLGSTLARTLGSVSDARYHAAVRKLASEYSKLCRARSSSNPFGVPYPEEVSHPDYRLEERSGIHSGFVWGHGWDLQEDAMDQYFLHRHLPDMFGSDAVWNVVSFVLGAHPAGNKSFVSGVGANSALVAYGYNRAEWSHIPGGVISGTSLIKPDFLELKEFPFLWYQTEYVLSGAATYIFDVLAAQKLAAER